MPDSYYDPNFGDFNPILKSPESPADIQSEKIEFRILEIQNQIQRTFDFCDKVLKTKYESLLAELRNFFFKNHLDTLYIQPSSVEFVTNLFNIKTCITETFGYLNISSIELNQPACSSRSITQVKILFTQN